MRAARRPIQRHPNARLLHVDARGAIAHHARRELADLVRPGDLIVANDAATLPASLRALHERTGADIEIRLAGRGSIEPSDMQRFSAIVFGAGDHRTRTENRPLPPPLEVGDRIHVGRSSAVIEALLDHPRFVRLRFDAEASVVWRTLADAGRPVQYAHMVEPLALWDVWTPLAANPVAYEPPSAGFALDWEMLGMLSGQGAQLVTLTHAAGISSTGDDALDARLPLDEPYFIPAVTANAIAAARALQKRVIAIGTTVVRALEHAARVDGAVHAGHGTATQRIDAATTLAVVDALLSGTHEVGSSHYELLRAFLSDETLTRVTGELEASGYLTHEFGDSVLVEADARRYATHISRANASTGRSGRRPYTPRLSANEPAPCGSRISSSIVCPKTGRSPPPISKTNSRVDRCNRAARSRCRVAAGCTRAWRSATYTRRTGNI